MKLAYYGAKLEIQCSKIILDFDGRVVRKQVRFSYYISVKIL
jgi:hypothetical protein